MKKIIKIEWCGEGYYYLCRDDFEGDLDLGIVKTADELEDAVKDALAQGWTEPGFTELV